MQRAICNSSRQLFRRGHAHRAFGTTTARASSAFDGGPAPPRLPKEEQETFERLQRQSTGAFSTPRTETPASSPTADIRMRINQSPDSDAAPTSSATAGSIRVNQSPHTSSSPQGEHVQVNIEGGARIQDGDEVHPNLRRGAPPEFEGDVNPTTGEVGGPKNEPLRWGSTGDWSYNGRVTDF